MFDIDNCSFFKAIARQNKGNMGKNQKNCLTDFYGSDIRALRGIALMLFGAKPIVKTYIIVNKPG